MTRSVLVVDDDASFRDLVTRVFGGSEYVVTGEAGSVEDALARALELEPDTALVDVGLPDGDGFSLAKSLSAMPWAPCVVVISTDGDGGSTLAAHRSGACGFLLKADLSAAAFRQLVEEA